MDNPRCLKCGKLRRFKSVKMCARCASGIRQRALTNSPFKELGFRVRVPKAPMKSKFGELIQVEYVKKNTFEPLDEDSVL